MEAIIKRQRSPEDQLYLVGWIFLLVGGAGILIYLSVIAPLLDQYHYSCVIYRLFGIYCPGCGGTRAVRALLKGQVIKAAWYHPLVVYTVFIFGGFMLTQTMERLHIGRIKGWRFHEWHLYAAIAILIGNFILKNILLLGFGIAM